MIVEAIYCTECGRLIGARDTDTGEVEHHGRWCGYDSVDKCWGCYNELHPDKWWAEDEDE